MKKTSFNNYIHTTRKASVPLKELKVQQAKMDEAIAKVTLKSARMSSQNFHSQLGNSSVTPKPLQKKYSSRQPDFSNKYYNVA
jgi:hypothetical protein